MEGQLTGRRKQRSEESRRAVDEEDKQEEREAEAQSP